MAIHAPLSEALTALNEKFAALEMQLGDLVAERDQLRSELIRLTEALVTLKLYGKWAGEQINMLVEKETEMAADLARKESEISVGYIRINGLQAELRATEAILQRREERKRHLKMGLSGRLGMEMQQTASAAEVFAAIYRRHRELERELDHEIVARQKTTGALERWERSSYAASIRFRRSIFAKGQHFGAQPNAIRRA